MRIQRSTDKWVAKAGGQVPDYVQEAMERLHPTVDILWHMEHQRWCLVQNVRGEQHLIRVLGSKTRFEPPTLHNTVNFLNACHPARLENTWERERFLRELDQKPEAERIARRSRDQIREGSKDLFNVLNNRVVVAKP